MVFYSLLCWFVSNLDAEFKKIKYTSYTLYCYSSTWPGPFSEFEGIYYKAVMDQIMFSDQQAIGEGWPIIKTMPYLYCLNVITHILHIFRLMIIITETTY